MPFFCGDEIAKILTFHFAGEMEITVPMIVLFAPLEIAQLCIGIGWTSIFVQFRLEQEECSVVIYIIAYPIKVQSYVTRMPWGD